MDLYFTLCKRPDMWQTMDTAPRDGTVIRAKTATSIGSDLWSFRVKWIDGKWCANFGSAETEDWKTFDPQPLVWRSMRDKND
jgi:hypothetical protein